PSSTSSTLFPYTTLFRSAVVLAGEGDHGPVRRKDRVGLDPDAGGQPFGVAPCPPDQPEVAGIDEDDVGAVDRRLLQQRRRAGLRSEEHTSELQSPDHLVC